MKVARSIAEFADLRSSLDGGRIVHVPTMGALHDGHKSLIRLAHSLGDQVVVSIFVNPLQFGPDEDYARYPRPVGDDLETCLRLGVDLVLVPTVSDLYPAGRQVMVSAGAMGSVLEGESRPGHFDGVLTVVLKLFNIIRPDVAIFGQKDAQQLACVTRMVTDLNLAVEVVGAPTVREPDGLALSSRNIFLSPSHRPLALSLSAALFQAVGQDSVPAARQAAYAVLERVESDPAFELQYATVVNPATFAEVGEGYDGPASFVVAAKVGSTRLVDNAALTFAPVAAVETV